ncbi:MAG TPA: hypothetical protein PKO28_02175 [Bacilli bacterium]|nr:hypothetical protein [Bacilli bacterium]HPS19035.1 hypothetical protein [Bacilli bacterium]
MKINKANLAYAFLCNIPVSACLCIAANFSNNSGNFIWSDFLLNYAISLPVAILISLFVPLVGLGKWFTSLFGIEHETFTNNLMYRLLATLFSSFIYFMILNPVLAVFNVVISGVWLNVPLWLFNWMRSLPGMLAVGFFSSLFFDIPAYRIAHKIDPKF